MNKRAPRSGQSDGPSTDAANVPVVDPTENVRNMLEAAIHEQNALREAEAKRTDDLRTVEEDCDKEKSELRKELVIAESKRIDSVIAIERLRVDAVMAEQKAAATLANEKQTAQATQLATQVTTTAAAMATQTKDLRDALEKRITTLEQNLYQTGGREVGKDEATALARQASDAAKAGQRWIIGLAVVIALFIAGQMILALAKP